MFDGLRDRKLITKSITDDGQLAYRLRVAQLGRAADKIERCAPILGATNSGSCENSGQLQRVRLILLRSRLDQSYRIVRRERRIAADEQTAAEFVLRARVAALSALLQ